MTEWRCEIVKLGKIGKHPNADSLSITHVYDGYPVIFRTGDYQEDDLAVYVPVDSIVPDTAEFAFLQGKRRIKAKKIRGIFSQGMLVKIPEHLKDVSKYPVGTVVSDEMKIVKDTSDEEVSTSSGGDAEKEPTHFNFIKYTDIEGLRRYKNVLVPGEEVVITEKIHGTCSRFVHDGTRLWCGSRNQIKREDAGIHWWAVAQKLNLEEKLKQIPNTIVFGEIYGKSVQKLTYDTEKTFVVFDTYNTVTHTWNDWDKTVEIADLIGLPTVPVLYRGPWSYEDCAPLAEGKSTIANHIKEGFVVKPVKERVEHVGRVIFKLIGQEYLLWK